MKLKIKVNIVACSVGYYPKITDANSGKTVAVLDPMVDGYDPWNKNDCRKQAGIWIKNYRKALRPLKNEQNTWEPDREYQIGYAHACGYRD